MHLLEQQLSSSSSRRRTIKAASASDGRACKVIWVADGGALYPGLVAALAARIFTAAEGAFGSVRNRIRHTRKVAGRDRLIGTKRWCSCNLPLVECARAVNSTATSRRRASSARFSNGGAGGGLTRLRRTNRCTVITKTNRGALAKTVGERRPDRAGLTRLPRHGLGKSNRRIHGDLIPFAFVARELRCSCWRRCYGCFEVEPNVAIFVVAWAIYLVGLDLRSCEGVEFGLHVVLKVMC